MAYIKGEDAGCEYLEVNEIIEDIWGIDWQPPRECKMVTSDLVYSPAQVTEHRHMELKDQNISEETKMKFEELKEQFPKVFSLNNEDIGRTQLVTMDIDMGDSPPVCQKPYTLPLKYCNWVQQEIETLEHAGVIRKSISPWASPIVIVPKTSAPGEPPHRRMCIDLRKLNELQPKLKDYEFGHYAFETLPKARSKTVHEILTLLDGVNVCEIKITYDNSENSPYSNSPCLTKNFLFYRTRI